MKKSFEKNMIFCFTGTGNSLKVSKDIAGILPNCEIRHMKSENSDADISGCKRVGFVFPVYFLGLPLQVKDFIAKLRMPRDCDGYFFCVGTYANVRGNATRQAAALLRARGHEPKYAANIQMGDNAIAFYGSTPNWENLANAYGRGMTEILPGIESMRERRTGREWWPVKAYYNLDSRKDS